MAVRFFATPPMRREPMASTRACSIASNTARACWPPGAILRCTAGSWQASRNAIESAWPRTIAASRSFKRRGGSGSRALPPTSPGRSEAKPTSKSPLPEIARRQTPTARLNGSVGASLALLFGLMFDDMQRLRPGEPVALPASGERRLLRERHVDRALRQFLAEAALIEFRHQRTLELVAFVDEGQPEGEADIAENLGVLRPGDHRARAHHGRNIAVDEGVAREIGDPHHFRDDLAALGRAIMLRLREHDFDLVIVRQIIQRGDDRPAIHLALVDLLGAVVEARRVAKPDGVCGGEQAERDR